MFVKICGITNEEDALLAVALDADAVGFVFAPSTRQVRPDDVRDIAKRLPYEAVTVGVFRNERPERVVEIVHKANLRAAQLHGGEPDSDVAYVAERVPIVIRALPAGDARLSAAAAWPTDLVLVDSPEPGSGEMFDWGLTRNIPEGVRVLLAGGLTPENVADAVRTVRPWGVDVSSGVESSPGRKDPLKLKEFVRSAREAGAALEASGVSEAAADVIAGEDEPGPEPPYDWMADR